MTTRDDEDALVTELLAGSADGAPPTEEYDIVVIDGPDAGQRLRIAGDEPTRVLVGQSSACALRLTDRTVSRRHVAFEGTERGLHMTDLESTNGTAVGGVRVLEAILRGGESVRMGETTLRVEALGATARPLSTAMRFGRVVGGSPEMRRIYPLCARLAASDVPIIVEGETGTGKEVLAEALHDESKRSAGPFVVFDCTAVPPELFESALFGHERGAFTGAIAKRRGAFEQADGGTLLIDEIGDLAPPLQAKLLRAIERSEFQPVGSDRWQRADVRAIAATRRDLDREVAEGRFRDDLFFRLSVGRIELPPLRRRHGDVALLARFFQRSLDGADQPLPADVIARFETYSWPGNVRELRNAVARRLALGDLEHAEWTKNAGAPAAAGDAGADDVVARVLACDLPLARARQKLVAEFEDLYVQRVLDRHGGNVRRAAAASGIARRYFQILNARRRPGGDP